MEPIFIIFLLIVTFINWGFLSMSGKNAEKLQEAVPILEEYVKAFTEVKTTVNVNAAFSQTLSRASRDQAETIAKLFSLIEILYISAKLNPPSPTILESEEGQLEPQKIN